MTRLFTTASLTAALTLSAGSAFGAITYVGATGGASGNTINLETASPGNQTDWYSGLDDGSNDARVGNDGLWGAVGTQGFVSFDASLTAVWEAGSSSTGVNSEDVPELQTTVSGLSAGVYNVYVLYETATGAANNWDISAGFNGGAKATYRDEGIIDAESGPYDLRRVLLGQSIGTSFTVEVDQIAGGDRSRYIGVAYDLVPEPSSLALLGLGGLLVARRRRG